MNRYLRYLWYNMTHEQIDLVINNYFKFDIATGKLVSQREQFCFCTYTYQHHLQNLSYQTHAKLGALKSSCEGTFLTKWLSETIVVCSTLRVKLGIHTFVYAMYFGQDCNTSLSLRTSLNKISFFISFIYIVIPIM